MPRVFRCPSSARLRRPRHRPGRSNGCRTKPCSCRQSRPTYEQITEVRIEPLAAVDMAHATDEGERYEDALDGGQPGGQPGHFSAIESRFRSVRQPGCHPLRALGAGFLAGRRWLVPGLRWRFWSPYTRETGSSIASIWGIVSSGCRSLAARIWASSSWPHSLWR